MATCLSSPGVARGEGEIVTANGAALRYFLLPGTIFAHHEEHVVTTILGSCVAVCLLDPYTRIGGMNHFMLPFWNGDGLPTPKYGNIALARLVERMDELGGSSGRMVAKLFGGAKLISSGAGVYPVGERNVILARKLLAEHGIPITAEDVGGESGRKVIFNTWSGEVLVGRMAGGGRSRP